MIKSDSGIMWWDEAAPRKVNVKLSIVGRKKEFIHKFDLVFETDEVHTFQNMSGKCYVSAILLLYHPPPRKQMLVTVLSVTMKNSDLTKFR